MGGRAKPGIRDYVVIAIVVCGHAALVVLFARIREQERTPTVASRSMRVVPVPLDVEPERPVDIFDPQIPLSTAISVPAPRLESATTDSQATQRPTATPDWRSEAARSARNAIRAQEAPGPRGFDKRETPAPAPKVKPFGWDPSPGRFGMAGGLPYMKLGKRCAIGLGFFGCAIGELPPPDGTLFEDMDDPDRERSSVPEPSP